MPNISRSKDNQTMKFGPLIECNKRREIFFYKNHAENETRRLFQDIFLFLRKALYEVKVSGLQLRFNII